MCANCGNPVYISAGNCWSCKVCGSHGCSMDELVEVEADNPLDKIIDAVTH